ncbi:hypothetical protein N9L76_06905 [bacterium]|nr:hypothetical protein [bacterium]
MTSLAKYVFLSFAVAGGLVYHALKTREQYFPAMMYLSTSKLSVVVLGNLAFALTLCFGHILKAIFLGTLREAEIERLYERAKDAIMETCLAMTIFREEFNVKFVVLFVSLLFVKIFHWLAGDRVEFMEQSPSTTRLAHLRVCSLVVLLVALDSAFLGYAVAHTLKKGPSVLLLFGFEYVILASRAVAVAVKYVIAQVDSYLDGRWDGKGTCVFYLELMTDLLHLFVYFVFFLIIFAYYGLPVHLVRDLYVTFRNFRRRVADFLRYRKVTANLNERFPDCTQEELENGDDVCIICREDMVCSAPGGSKPKKLPCGHVFHLGCLRSWLERQQACPTCRAPVLPEVEHEVNARVAAREVANGGDAAHDAAMRAAFQRELFGEQAGEAQALEGQQGQQVQGQPAPAPAAAQASIGDVDAQRRTALEAATRRAEAGQAAVSAGAMPMPLAPPPATHQHVSSSTPQTPPTPAQWPQAAQQGNSPMGATPGWMRPQQTGQHAHSSTSPWTSIAATAAGDTSTDGSFSPAQAHQIAAATASAVAAAAAQAQLAMFGLVPLGMLPPNSGFGPVGGLGGATPAELAAAAAAASSLASNPVASPLGRNFETQNFPVTSAMTAVARAEVALLEAKMDVLQEQLEAANAQSARMEAMSGAGSNTQSNETPTKLETERNEKGKAPVVETQTPPRDSTVRNLNAESSVASGSQLTEENTVSESSEAEAIRKARVDRFQERE